MDRKIATTWNVAVPTTANGKAVPTTAKDGVRLIRMWVDSGLVKSLGDKQGWSWSWWGLVTWSIIGGTWAFWRIPMRFHWQKRPVLTRVFFFACEKV